MGPSRDFPEAGVELSVSHALEEAKAQRGLAMALSGGGYRAALFHLGGLRRLNELGILSQVEAFSAVSGGSILAAHLACSVKEWPEPGEPIDDWESNVARPFRAFTRRDIRTPSFVKGMVDPTGGAAKHLARHYDRYITRGKKLVDLPKKPNFVFCASDLSFGVAWYYARDKIGDYQVGTMPTPDQLLLAEAVAASSCFPPVFAPLDPKVKPDQLEGGLGRRRDDYANLVEHLRLTDGGLYDNMGLEPVWKDSQMLLVSDGGAPFKIRTAGGFFKTLLRYNGIQENQSRSMRKRWLMRKFQRSAPAGTYWGVGSPVAAYDRTRPGYSEKFVDQRLARVRTDMDGFSSDEIEAIENHGYLLANAAIHRWMPKLIAREAPLAIPHESAMKEENMMHAMRKSHRRFLKWLW